MTSREAHVVTHCGFRARLFPALMDDGELSFSSCGSDHLKGLLANTYVAGFFGSTHLFTLASAERFLSLSTPLCYSAVQVLTSPRLHTWTYITVMIVYFSSYLDLLRFSLLTISFWCAGGRLFAVSYCLQGFCRLQATRVCPSCFYSLSLMKVYLSR